MMEWAVDLDGINKRYGKLRVLDGLSLRLRPGKFHGLLGKNGTGKSTLMRVLARHEAAEGGSGSVLGRAFPDDDADLTGRVGYATEDVTFSLDGSLARSAALFARLHPRWNDAEFREHCGELEVPLGSAFRRLSRGQRIRFWMCVVLASRPELFLLDEITAALDARARGYIVEVLAAHVAASATVLLATNIVSELTHHADELVLLDAGKVQLQGTVEEIAARFVKVRVSRESPPAFVQEPHWKRIGHGDPGLLGYVAERASLGGVELPAECLDASAITPEEIFVHLTAPERAQEPQP